MYSKSPQKTLSWEVCALLDAISITLGQRDLSILLCICKDNFGEAEVLDVFLTEEMLPSPSDQSDSDHSVKALETFFCEPKQKSVITKFSLEGVKLSLYFDSGELLSSPVRDLNHGLCIFELDDVFVFVTVYTDRSLDGKLSVDSVLIEEIGPSVNIPERQ